MSDLNDLTDQDFKAYLNKAYSTPPAAPADALADTWARVQNGAPRVTSRRGFLPQVAWSFAAAAAVFAALLLAPGDPDSAPTSSSTKTDQDYLSSGIDLNQDYDVSLDDYGTVVEAARKL